MNDSEKTKAELHAEVKALRKKLADLEQRSAPEPGETAARLAHILEIAEDAIISFDTEQRILQFNKGAERIFGYAPAEMIGRPLDDLLPQQSRSAHGRHFQMLMAGPESSRAKSVRPEIQGLRKNGKTFPAEASIAKIGHGRGKIFTVFLRDITQQVEASRELEESREAARQAHARLLDIIESLPGSFALYDAEDRLVLTNRKTLEFFPDHAPMLKPGTKYEDVIRLSIDKNLIPFDAERKEEMIRERLREHRENDGVVEQSWTDGRWFELHHRKTSDGGTVSIRMDITDRKKAEEERAASQRLLQTVFDALPLGVAVKDLDTRYQIVNKAFADNVNRTPEEMIGRTSKELGNRTKSEEGRIADSDRSVLESGEWYENPDASYTFPDGTQSWRRILKGPIHDEDGRITGLLVIREDIHQRKQAEKELAASQRLLQTVFDSIPIGVSVKDLDLKYQMVNKAFAAHSDLPPEQFIGRTFHELSGGTEDEIQRVAERDRRVVQNGEWIETPEEIYTFADGTQRWRRAIKGPIHDEQGRIIGLLGIREDIHERKQTEDELRENRRVLQAIFDTVPFAVMVKNLEGKYVMANRVVGSWFDMRPEDMLGLTVDDLPFLSDAQKARIRETDQESHASNRLIEYPEIPITIAGGKEIIQRIFKMPLNSESGEVIGHLSIAEDITERKRAEEALRESEARFRSIMDHSMSVIFLKDVEGRYLLVNRQFEERFGITAENVIGKTSFDLLPREEAESLMAQEQEVLKTGKPVEWEQDITNVDGIHRMISIKFPVFSPSGEIIGIGTNGIDITERNRAEEALRESEAKFRSIMDHSLDVIILKDLKGRYLLVNRRYEELYGQKSEEIIGKSPFDLYPVEEAEKVMAQEQEVINTGIPVEWEKDMTFADGKHRMLTTKFPVFSPTGEIVGIGTTSTDITERKRAGEALRESEAKFRDLVETSQDLIWRLDTEGRFIYLNPAWEECLGYTLEEMLGRPFTDFKEPGEAEKTLTVYRETLGGKTFSNYVTSYLTKAGEKRVFNFIAKPSIDAGGNTVGTQGTAHDITERRMLEVQLRQSQKMEALGTLAGGIAHDFNNILAPIMGYAEILIAKAEPGSRDQDNLNTILRSAVRAKDLVSQILLFSRRVESEKKSCHLVPVVKDVFRLARSTFPKTIAVVVEIAEDTAPVVCDPNQIHQALLNLCVNAGQALTDAGEMKIMIDRIELHQAGDFSGKQFTGNFVRLAVSDTGVGMDENTLRQIFDPFFTTKEVGQGTGLGLSTVFGIVREHDGGIFVSSQPGKGSLFEIVLPAAESTGRHFLETMPLAPNGGERILFVDDEREIADLSKTILEDFGYQVTATSDSNQALRIFLDGPADFDLVITDQSMPRMKGENLAQELRRANPDIPIIICTGHSDYMTPEFSQERGFDAFLYKPFSANELSRVVRDVLDRRIAGD